MVPLLFTVPSSCIARIRNWNQWTFRTIMSPANTMSRLRSEFPPKNSRRRDYDDFHKSPHTNSNTLPAYSRWPKSRFSLHKAAILHMFWYKLRLNHSIFRYVRLVLLMNFHYFIHHIPAWGNLKPKVFTGGLITMVESFPCSLSFQTNSFTLE